MAELNQVSTNQVLKHEVSLQKMACLEYFLYYSTDMASLYLKYFSELVITSWLFLYIASTNICTAFPSFDLLQILLFSFIPFCLSLCLLL